jgi:Ca-activated chloride channel family protein
LRGFSYEFVDTARGGRDQDEEVEMSGRRWRTRLAAAVGSLILGGGLAVSAAPPAQAADDTQVLLLLDVSGSMNEKISSGGTKFAAAKRALREVADSLPAGTQVGLRVYGSEIAEPKDENPKACTDTELVLPIGPLDKGKMNDAVDSFTAQGETPIAYSLQQSVKDFGDDGKRVLVLISDGEETCAKDPCPTAKKLAKSGVDLQFNAIGLDVGAKARKQLQCITKAGDGNYYDAGNTSDLNDALRRITQRALRPFQVTGIPVEGTEDAGSAPQIGPGQYKDRYDASTIERYYRITRTPGSTVTASIGSIVRPYPRQNAEQWTMTMTTPDGVACATTQATTGSWKAVTPFGASISSAQVDGATRKPRAACETAPELTLSLKRQSLLGNDDDVAVEVVVAEEPEITNMASLPEPVTGYDGKTGRVKAGKASAVLGGTSFSNATEVSSGTYTDSMATGETVFYRVRLQPGQRVRATATTPAPKSSWHLAPAEAITTRVMLYSPSRTLLTSQEDNQQGDGSVTVSAGSPQVRVRNREAPVSLSWGAPSVSTASQAGDYYVAVQVDPLQNYLTGRVMPTRVAIAVDGAPAGLPEYAAPASPTPTPDPSASTTPATTAEPSDQPGGSSPAEDADGVPTWLTVAGVAVVAAAAGAAGVLLARRRSGLIDSDRSRPQRR